MERMEEFGVPRWIVSFVIPTGYSFNMTGGSVYLSMAAVFVAQAAGIHLTFGRQIAVVLVLMAASKGIAGVPRASLVVLLATASAVHLPTAPILLILGVDTLMDMGRTMMNVVGNCMAAAVIGRTEGALATPHLLVRCRSNERSRCDKGRWRGSPGSQGMRRDPAGKRTRCVVVPAIRRTVV